MITVLTGNSKGLRLCLEPGILQITKSLHNCRNDDSDVLLHLRSILAPWYIRRILQSYGNGLQHEIA